MNIKSRRRRTVAGLFFTQTDKTAAREIQANLDTACMKAFRPVHLPAGLKFVPLEANAAPTKATVKLMPNSPNAIPNWPLLAAGLVRARGECMSRSRFGDVHEQDCVENKSQKQAPTNRAARRPALKKKKKRLLGAIAEVFLREAVSFEQPACRPTRSGLSDSFGPDGMSYSSFRPPSLSPWI